MGLGVFSRLYVLPLAFVANAMFVATMQRLVHYAGGRTDSSASGSIKLAKERIALMKRYDIMD